MRWCLLVFFSFVSTSLYTNERLWKDLDIVSEIDRSIREELPLLINYQLQGGYFAMPSARMAKDGIVGFGFSYLPPYQIYNLLFQYFGRLEITGNYWIYQGILEKHFGHLGFGDDAERAANLKVSLFKISDGIPFFSELAIGCNDFIGTKRFRSWYIVSTQTFKGYNLELTLGWGAGRIHGFFAGVGWTPFRNTLPLLQDITIAAEYDANNYKHHSDEHPEGREIKTRFNLGLQWKLFPGVHLSCSSIRGKDVAASIVVSYNLGDTKGVLPKVKDSLAYSAPLDTEPIGSLRSQKEVAQELSYAFQEQDLSVYQIVLIPRPKGKNDLWIKIINVRYRDQQVVRERVESVLAALTPSNVDNIFVIIEADGIPVYQYHFRTINLYRHRQRRLGKWELDAISPLQEASVKPNPFDSTMVYYRKKSIWLLTVRPTLRPYFGSSTGKFKYDVGFLVSPEGYLFNEIYYCISASYTIYSSAYNINACDFLNPSQLVNVRSDSIYFHLSNVFRVDNAYLQKSWNLGRGWYTRLAFGYFETAYTGVAWEALYYPVYANWAIGIEAATVLKRKYRGLGLTRKIRKLEGYCPIYVPYIGFQYFLNFYYRYRPLQIDGSISLGQFLAKDKGVRFELGRTFASGLRIGFWYTVTDGNDRINNHRYYDKGFSITFPLDIFMKKSSRTMVVYAMSAWLRDVGAKAKTGKELYPTIFSEKYTDSSEF